MLYKGLESSFINDVVSRLRCDSNFSFTLMQLQLQRYCFDIKFRNVVDSEVASFIINDHNERE